jgi:nicotinamidase-related amidase
MRNPMKPYFFPALVLAVLFNTACFAEEPLTVTLQQKVPTQQNPNVREVSLKKEEWKAAETAIIICDMWNEHWCKNCTARVAELAGPMNEMLTAARNKGVLIIHAPSETMHTYENTPQRKTAQAFLNKDEEVNNTIKGWQTRGLDTEKGRSYPIQVVSDGCDCPVRCPPLGEYQRNHGGKSPWQHQIKTITIADNDLVSDSGNEIGAYLKAKGYKNVAVCGVATNMCVMGRPFGLRAMKRLGFNTVLVRDLTDTMYSPQGSPYVSHFEGTDLMVNYIETFVCPSILSTDFHPEGKPFKFAY